MPTRRNAALLALLALWVASAAEAERALLRSQRPAVVDMRAAALIMSGQQGGALPIAVVAVPDGKACRPDLSDAFAKCRLTAVVEVDGAALLETSSDGSLPIEVFAYVLGEELDVLDQQSLKLDAGSPRSRELLINTGLKAFLSLEVAPGTHQLRILVHASGTFGLRGLPLHVGTTGARISPPIFQELTNSWLLAAPADIEIPLPSPFGLEQPAPLPAVRPQMPADGTLTGQILISISDPDNPPNTAELAAILSQREGETLEVPLSVLDRVSMEGLESLAISFSAPTTAGGGLWQLVVASADPALRSEPITIFLENAAPASLITDLDADRRVPARTRPLAGAGRKLARAVREGYLQALRQLADGNSDAAVKTLIASEKPVVEALDADAVSVLAESEAGILANMPDADWDCLLPVILMHLDVSRLYRKVGQRILAHHATQMTLHLANAYAHKLADAQASAEAAQALSSLAGYFQHSGSRYQAEKLFLEALELAPDPAALLGLGTLYEKSGRLEDAVPIFKRLMKELPTHDEGTLRLALNQARLGKVAPAQKALRQLMNDRADDWITLLAHQELARIFVDSDQLSQAAGVLRRGLKRWPSHPTLALQLAWILDTQDEGDSSLELLVDLDPSSTHAANERSRYNRWPKDLLANSRRALAQTAEKRLVDLGHWLSSRDSQG